MDEKMYQTEQSLEAKLRLVAEGVAVGLTPEEAAIYGADYSDQLEEEDNNGE